ncbi:MAG: PHB depolymerase family esterase [Balneolaceae bacterium]
MKFLIPIFTLTIMSTNLLSQTQMVTVGDDKRQVTIYSPSSIDADQKAPLLLNFHGSGMTAIEQMMYSQTNKLADEYGFVVAYPQGKNNDWNVGFDMEFEEGNDVKFIQILIQKIIKHYPVDSTKIYAIGISRGGFFAQRLMAELPGQINGFVSVGAPIPVEVYQRMTNIPPVKALYVHGTADQIVTINGKENAYRSLDESLQVWNGESRKLSTQSIEHYDTESNLVGIDIYYYGENASIAKMVIENGGHTWPGSDPFNIGLPLGLTAQGFDFNTFFWEFLIR